MSEATVSRVVNARPGVNEATRQRVERVLAEIGYQSPGIVRGRRSGVVGLIVPELSNPVFPAFAQTIEARLATRGYTIMLCTATESGVHEDEYIDMLLDRNVSGIVIVSGRNADTTADHRQYHELVARGMPVVFVNGVIEGLNAPFVSCDDRRASELAVQHLASLRHRRIGMVTGPQRYVVAQRKTAGFIDAIGRLPEGSLPPLVSESLFNVEGGHVAAQALLAEGITGIVAASDLMALGAIRAAHEMGFHVPDDVSVVGFDDTPLMAFTDPPLTTVRQPVLPMSEAAVRALLEQIEGHRGPCHEYVFRPELVVRGSTGPSASGAHRPSGRRHRSALAP